MFYFNTELYGLTTAVPWNIVQTHNVVQLHGEAVDEATNDDANDLPSVIADWSFAISSEVVVILTSLSSSLVYMERRTQFAVDISVSNVDTNHKREGI